MFIHICVAKIFWMDINQNELKALIKHEKRNLLFYSLYWDILAQNTPEREHEKHIDQFWTDCQCFSS